MRLPSATLFNFLSTVDKLEYDVTNMPVPPSFRNKQKETRINFLHVFTIFFSFFFLIKLKINLILLVCVRVCVYLCLSLSLSLSLYAYLHNSVMRIKRAGASFVKRGITRLRVLTCELLRSEKNWKKWPKKYNERIILLDDRCLSLWSGESLISRAHCVM